MPPNTIQIGGTRIGGTRSRWQSRTYSCIPTIGVDGRIAHGTSTRPRLMSTGSPSVPRTLNCGGLRGEGISHAFAWPFEAGPTGEPPRCVFLFSDCTARRIVPDVDGRVPGHAEGVYLAPGRNAPDHPGNRRYPRMRANLFIRVDCTTGHSEAITENIAESRSRPCSPGA